MVSPRLEELIIWFLEFAQLYIVVYGVVGIIIIIVIGTLWLKEQSWTYSITKVIPMFFFPMIFKQLVSNMDLIGVSSEMVTLVKYVDVFYVIPFILIGISILSGEH